ncbi:MAG: NnrU family protein [Hyphomicrobiales bacterium]
MIFLLSGIAVFAGVHLFSMLLPGQRDGLRARLGERPWKWTFVLISLLGLALIVRGFLLSRSGPAAADLLYIPPDSLRPVTALMVLMGFIAIGAAHGKGYIKSWIKQPMSIGIALWAAGHLLANGKRAAVYMFGAFLALALLDIILSTARGKLPAHEPRIRSDAIAAIAGMVLFAIFLFGFHPYVLNLPVAG